MNQPASSDAGSIPSQRMMAAWRMFDPASDEAGFVLGLYHKLRIPSESLHVAIADVAALPRRLFVGWCDCYHKLREPDGSLACGYC